jgi:hypothetical protein
LNYLLDEQLHETAARSLDALGGPQGDAFSYILDHRDTGTPDDEIPALCAEVGATVLVTANVRDFGARKRYYEALLDAGISVVVIRPSKGRFLPGNQVALFATHYARIGKLLADADGALLIRVTHSDAHPRSLADLVAETDEPDRNP